VAKLPHMKPFLVALLLALFCAPGEAASLDEHADKLASLIDPAKLGTRGKRGANPRIQKAVAILADAESEKPDAARLLSRGGLQKVRTGAGNRH